MVDGAAIAGEEAPGVRAPCLSQVQSTKPEKALVKVPISCLCQVQSAKPERTLVKVIINSRYN